MKKNYKYTDKSTFVQNLFENIAINYDFLNNVISLGMHKKIKKQAIKNLPIKKDMRVLDLCTGTADIAIIFSQLFGNSVEITAADFSENMLKIAEEKTKKYKNIKIIKTDAMNMPFEDSSFDIVFISFGLRNLENITDALTEIKRVLKDDGIFSSLDTGKPRGLLKHLFNIYFSYIVPVLGMIFQKNYNAYKYLPESAKNYPSQEMLLNILTDSGFIEAENHNWLFGTIAQQTAKINKKHS